MASDTIVIDPNTVTHEQLRALNDSWITMYVNEIERLEGDLELDQLIHIGQSFGRPGSLTEGGQRYRAHTLEMEITRMQLLMCLLYRGHVTINQVEVFKHYDTPRP
jgi:hypothetical protein